MIKWLLLGLVVLSLLVAPIAAACAKPTPPVPAPAPAPKPAPAPAPKPADPIIIGNPTCLGHPLGRGGTNSITMAAEEINAAGGVSVGGVKRPLKVVSIDTRSMSPGMTVADAVLAFKKLVLEEKPDIIVSDVARSEIVMATMDVAAEYKIPMIECGAKSPTIFKKVAENYDTQKYNFFMSVNVVYQIGYLVDLYKYIGDKFGFNKIYLMGEDALFCHAMLDIVSAQLEKAGFEVLGVEFFPTGTTDFSMALTKADKAGAQIIGAVSTQPESAILVEQHHTMKLNSLLAGDLTVVGGDEGIWKAYGGRVEATVCWVCEAGNAPVSSVPESVKYYESYVKRWGKGPGILSVPAPSYDATYVMAAAIERAGSLDADALVKALEATDLKGAIGRIRFNKENHGCVYGNDPEETAVGFALQWQQPGRRVAVWPPAVAEQEMVLPPWMRK